MVEVYPLSISEIESGEVKEHWKEGKYTVKEFVQNESVRRELYDSLILQMKLNVVHKRDLYQKRLQNLQTISLQKYAKILKVWHEKLVKMGHEIFPRSYNTLQIWILLLSLFQKLADWGEHWLNEFVYGFKHENTIFPHVQKLDPHEKSSRLNLDKYQREATDRMNMIDKAILEPLQSLVKPDKGKVSTSSSKSVIKSQQSLIKSAQNIKEKLREYAQNMAYFIIKCWDENHDVMKSYGSSKSPACAKRFHSYLDLFGKLVHRSQEHAQTIMKKLASNLQTLNPEDVNEFFLNKNESLQNLGDKENISSILKDHYPDFFTDQMTMNEITDILDGLRDICGSLTLVQVQNSNPTSPNPEHRRLHTWATRNWIQLIDILNKALINLKGRENILDTVFSYVQAFARNYKNAYQYLNFALLGPAGTGKTTIAQYIGKIMLYAGILTHNVFKQVSRGDLVGQYLGQTAPRTKKVLESAREGVLFIDEVYSLVPCVDRPMPDDADVNDKSWMIKVPCRRFDSYGDEALTTIVDFLSQNKGLICMIIAGYTEDSLSTFFQANEGIPRRFPNQFILTSYSTSVLIRIYQTMTMSKLRHGNGDKVGESFIQSMVKSINDKTTEDELKNREDELIIHNRLRQTSNGNEEDTGIFAPDALQLLNTVIQKYKKFFQNQAGDMENLASITSRYVNAHDININQKHVITVCIMADILKRYMYNKRAMIRFLDIKCT